MGAEANEAVAVLLAGGAVEAVAAEAGVVGGACGARVAGGAGALKGVAGAGDHAAAAVQAGVLRTRVYVVLAELARVEGGAHAGAGVAARLCGRSVLARVVLAGIE